MIYGMTNPGSLPGPVDPQNPGPYLQSQYPNADAELIAKMIGETGPLAQRRLQVSESHARAAEANALRRERELDPSAPPKPATTSQRVSIINSIGRLTRSMADAYDDAEREAYQQQIDELQGMLGGAGGEPTGRSAPRKYNPSTGRLE
jgi:hypothetical protein